MENRVGWQVDCSRVFTIAAALNWSWQQGQQTFDRPASSLREELTVRSLVIDEDSCHDDGGWFIRPQAVLSLLSVTVVNAKKHWPFAYDRTQRSGRATLFNAKTFWLVALPRPRERRKKAPVLNKFSKNCLRKINSAEKHFFLPLHLVRIAMLSVKIE